MKTYEETLTHHGVKGMKWGVRRTPEQLGHKLKYTSPTREQIKRSSISAAENALARLVPGYSLFVMARSGASIVSSLNRNLDRTDYVDKEGSVEKISELKRKNSKTSMYDDMQNVNPRIGQQKGAVKNCMYCTMAMEMRSRGYDVRARKKAQGTSLSFVKECFEGVEILKPTLARGERESRQSYVRRSYDNLCNQIEKFPNGSRGFVSVQYEKVGSGHILNWEVQNGSVAFYDGQCKSTKNDRTFSLANPTSYTYGRLDNLKINEKITESVISK